MKPASQSELPAVVELLPSKRDSFPLVNIDALLNKAIDAKSAVEIMERLQVMRRELRAEQSKEAFDSAMADFQSECPIIAKTKAGAKNAYHYAPLDAILMQVRPLIRQHGFSFSITSEIDKGWVKAICKITHAQGHSESSEFKAPVDERNPMMTDPQRYGAAMTFAKRYAFANSFGILTADSDEDGSTRPKPAGPSTLAADLPVKELAQELWTVLKPVRGEKKDWIEANNWLWREEILDAAVPESAPDLTPKRFKEIIAKAKEKLK